MTSIRSAREAASDFLGTRTLSAPQMVNILNGRAKTLRQLDRTFEVELAFLNSQLEKQLCTKVHDMVLDCFTTGEKIVTIAQAIQSMHKVKVSAQVCAGGAAVEGEVDGVIALLGNLSTGLSPKDKDIASMTEFYKLVWKRSENFFTVPVAGLAEGVVLGNLKGLKGAEVVLAYFSLLEARIASEEGSKNVSLESVQPLRNYHWVLSAAQ